jgi:hypothetical protein
MGANNACPTWDTDCTVAAIPDSLWMLLHVAAEMAKFDLATGLDLPMLAAAL